MAIIVVFCLYLLLSPKNPFVSMGRILAVVEHTRPDASDYQRRATRHAVAFNGDSIVVSAEVRGLKENEPVLLHFSTADGQVIDQAVPMRPWKRPVSPPGPAPPASWGSARSPLLPDSGDFRTETYRVEVQIPPSIVIDRLEYHYPAYTGLPDRSRRAARRYPRH